MPQSCAWNSNLWFVISAIHSNYSKTPFSSTHSHMHMNTCQSSEIHVPDMSRYFKPYTSAWTSILSVSSSAPISCSSLSPPDFHLSQPVWGLQLPVFLLLRPRSLLQPRPALGGADQAAQNHPDEPPHGALSLMDWRSRAAQTLGSWSVSVSLSLSLSVGAWLSVWLSVCESRYYRVVKEGEGGFGGIYKRGGWASFLSQIAFPPGTSRGARGR